MGFILFYQNNCDRRKLRRMWKVGEIILILKVLIVNSCSSVTKIDFWQLRQSRPVCLLHNTEEQTSYKGIIDFTNTHSGVESLMHSPPHTQACIFIFCVQHTLVTCKRVWVARRVASHPGRCASDVVTFRSPLFKWQQKNNPEIKAWVQ